MRHRLEYWLIAVVTSVVRVMPWALVHVIGTALGLAFYAVDGAHRRVTLANLETAFPVRSEKERRAIARGVFAHFGHMLVELLKFSTLTPPEMLARVEFEGDERARQAYAHGRGVFFFTGHFGFWEVCGIVHALRLAPIGLLARALDNPHLNDLLERVRQCTGNTVIYRRGALRRVLRMLEANQGVAILIDQHTHGPDAVPVDFFNRRAATTSTMAALALRTGAPAIPVFAIPIGSGRYRMVYEHPVEVPGPDSPDPVLELTQRCTDVLEMYVRRHPEMWLWMHRRWRHGEPGAAEERVRGMFPVATRDADVDPGAPGGEG
jgi:Kdo2-lipid IVA lauroyltransferase/acyltransferase